MGDDSESEAVAGPVVVEDAWAMEGRSSTEMSKKKGFFKKASICWYKTLLVVRDKN